MQRAMRVKNQRNIPCSFIMSAFGDDARFMTDQTMVNRKMTHAQRSERQRNWNAAFSKWSFL